MKLIVTIDALALEANWPRFARPRFVELLEASLAAELSSIPRRGLSEGRAITRSRRVIPGQAFGNPGAMSSALAKAIVSSIGPGGATDGAIRTGARRK